MDLSLNNFFGFVKGACSSCAKWLFKVQLRSQQEEAAVLFCFCHKWSLEKITFHRVFIHSVKSHTVKGRVIYEQQRKEYFVF